MIRNPLAGQNDRNIPPNSGEIDGEINRSSTSCMEGVQMSNIEKYRKYFTKDYLMGPNSFRLLDELIRRSPEGVRYDRTLDLGCGYALTSLFLANEGIGATKGLNDF